MAGTPAQNGNSAAGNSDFSRKAMELAATIRTWPTPLVADAGDKVTLASNQTGLIGAVHTFALADYSLPDRPTRSGLKSAETRRRLNPRFVEWLMGWPIGWTSFEHAETGLSAWLLLMRGELSTLCSRTPQQGTLL
jgi:hypothetical protein